MLRAEVCGVQSKMLESFPHLWLEFFFFDTVILLFISRGEGAPVDELVYLVCKRGNN